MRTSGPKALSARRIIGTAVAALIGVAAAVPVAGGQTGDLGDTGPGAIFDDNGPGGGVPTLIDTTTTTTETEPTTTTDGGGTATTPPPGSGTIDGSPSGASQGTATSGDQPGAAPSQDASGTPGLRALDPFPVVRIRGRIIGTGARISLLTVRAPLGARVSVRCRGTACPLPRLARSARARAVRVRPFERELRAGTIVEVTVTKPALIGKYTRFRIRRRGAPARSDQCLIPGERRPRACS